jgi:hypothetical protein
MSVLLPNDVSPEDLEILNRYYGETHIMFNGHYYDHTRQIHLKKDGGDYVLVPHTNESGKKLDVSKSILAVHHYVADVGYKFIHSFVSINDNFVCQLPEKAVLTTYLSRSFCFFRSLPPTVKSTLKENGRLIYDDYTKLKQIS